MVIISLIVILVGKFSLCDGDLYLGYNFYDPTDLSDTEVIFKLDGSDIQEVKRFVGFQFLPRVYCGNSNKFFTVFEPFTSELFTFLQSEYPFKSLTQAAILSLRGVEDISCSDDLVYFLGYYNNTISMQVYDLKKGILEPGIIDLPISGVDIKNIHAIFSPENNLLFISYISMEPHPLTQNLAIYSIDKKKIVENFTYPYLVFSMNKLNSGNVLCLGHDTRKWNETSVRLMEINEQGKIIERCSLGDYRSTSFLTTLDEDNKDLYFVDNNYNKLYSVHIETCQYTHEIDLGRRVFDGFVLYTNTKQ